VVGLVHDQVRGGCQQALASRRLARARTNREHVLLTDGDAPLAAVISISDLEELQRAQDDADIARCAQIKAASAPGLSHDTFMAMLAAEDAESA